MKHKLVVEPAAEDDIFHAYRWYEDRQTGLGQRYLAALDETFSTILDHPDLYSETIPGIRRSVTRTFPYLVFYTCLTSSVHILAVIHAAQDPKHVSARFDA